MSVEPKNTPVASATWSSEMIKLWQQLPNRGIFLGLLAGWVALFHWVGNSTLGYVNTPSLFGWWWWVESIAATEGGRVQFSRLLDSDESFGLLMPLVIVALLVWKRAELRAPPKRLWWPALGLVVLGLLTHVLGYMVQQTRISLMGFFIGLYGLSGLVWGPGWLRATFFPYLLFAFCVPLGNSAEYITFPMRMLVTKLSVGFGHHVLGIDVVRDGSRIFNSMHTFQYDVAPACSGIRSLMTLLALTTIYGFLTFRKNWKCWLMVLLAFPLAVLGNTTRITCVIVAAEVFGQDAGKAIETNLGFVTFLVALVVVLAVGHWLRDDKTKRPAPTADTLAPVGTGAAASPEAPV